MANNLDLSFLIKLIVFQELFHKASVLLKTLLRHLGENFPSRRRRWIYYAVRLDL